MIFEDEIIEEQIVKGYENDPALKTTVTKPLVNAIINRNPITFYYTGPRKPKKTSVKAGYRVKAEAVALGLNKKGNLVIRAWIDNPSKSKRGTPTDVGNEKANYGWRTFLVSRMSSIQVLKTETFNIPREKYKDFKNDKSMSVTYVKTTFKKRPGEPKPAPIKKEPAKQPISVKPPVKPAGVTKVTRNFDKEMTDVQNDLAKVIADLKATNVEYQKVKNEPKGIELLNVLKDLTQQKKDLEKKSDELVDKIAQAGVDMKNVNVQKFLSANRSIKKEPEITIPEPPKKPAKSPSQPTPTQPKEKGKLPEPKKTEKPNKKPEDDNRYDLSESFVHRVKKLISYF